MIDSRHNSSSLIDRAYRALERVAFPKRAAIREHWRKVDEDPAYRTAYEIGLRTRHYKAANHSKNHTQTPGSSPRSADAEIIGDLYTMRNRSRAANRDDALSSGITGTLVRGVVGTGLRPQARTGDDAKDEALEKVWADRKDQLSRGEGDLIHGMVQRLRYNKVVEDGEIFLHPAIETTYDPNGAPGRPAMGPLWIENIEADRVRSPADAEPADNKGRIIHGIEKDRNGVVVAYWIMNRHPGDTILWDTKVGNKAVPFASTFSKKYFNRIPADQVCHIRSRVTRPGQTRGVPTCHAIMQDLRDLDLLMLASLKRTQVAACLSAFIKSSALTTDLIELTAEDYGYQLEQKLEPGSIFRLFPGEEMDFLNPTAGVPDLDKFVLLLAKRIGSAIGLSPQAILRDWAGVSYSGARTIKTDDRQTYRGERSDFSGHALRWEWKIVMENELLVGNPDLLTVGITPADIDHIEWVGDEEPWVDPQAEAASIETMLTLGLTSKQIECARLGRDYVTVLKENLQAEMMERDMRDALGLPEAGAVAAGTQDAFGEPIEQPDEDINGKPKVNKKKPDKGRTFVVNMRQQPPAPAPNLIFHHHSNIQVPETKAAPPAELHPHFDMHLPPPQVAINLPEREFKFSRDKNGALQGAIAKDV